MSIAAPGTTLMHLAHACVHEGRSFVRAIDEARLIGHSAQALDDAISLVMADVVRGCVPALALALA